jgi:hypothetical protein
VSKKKVEFREGDIVRLTGENWKSFGMHGELATITSSEGATWPFPGFMHSGQRFYVYDPNWSAELALRIG